MIIISHKAKQFLVFSVKLLIVVGAFYFIYNQLVSNNQLDWVSFQNIVVKKTSIFSVLFLLSFSFINRYLEILKWQNLVSFIQTISIGESTKQVLGALTAGIFTPNGLGEYAGKALYYSKLKTKQIIFLNLICNGIQMILTIIFGTIGLMIIGYSSWVISIGLLVFSFWLIVFISKKIKIKGYSIIKLVEKINEIPKKVHKKNLVLAIGRYLVIVHQYYFLFLIFEVHLPYLTMIATIAVVYFLASSLPSFQFLDFAVKGSVAVFFFGKLNINEWIVVFITSLFWFLNVVIPIFLGSYFVLQFKPKWK